MSRVSYQLPGEGSAGDEPDFAPLPAGAIGTRRRDATASVTVTMSAAQARWLKRLERESPGAADAAVRALVDLGMELDVDWASRDGGRALRAAVQDAVRVRRHV